MLIYLAAFITAVSTVFFHFVGMDGRYMQYWWYDIFMHMLGGLAIGLLLSCIILLCCRNARRIKWFIILGVLAVGIAWEFFEIYYNLTGYPIGTKLYYIDTALDILDDIIGGCLAVYMFIKYRKAQGDTSSSEPRILV
jgi:hypothetical protein